MDAKVANDESLSMNVKIKQAGYDCALYQNDIEFEDKQENLCNQFENHKRY